MKNQTSTIRHQRFVRGFTLVECLIGLAISAILLTAVAAAFNASAVSYRENEDMFWTINNARQAMVRMTTQLRTAGYAEDGVTYAVAFQTAPSNRCVFYTPAGELMRYEYCSAEGKLYLINSDTSQQYLLCDGVTAATFTTTSTNGVDATSVQIALTVKSGNTSRSLSGAAVVRRNQGT